MKWICCVGGNTLQFVDCYDRKRLLRLHQLCQATLIYLLRNEDMFLSKNTFGPCCKCIWHLAPQDTLGDVKPLNPQDYSVGWEFWSMWSKIRSPCHQASRKGLALSWHGDSNDNGNNGVPELGGLYRSSSSPSVCSGFVLHELWVL